MAERANFALLPYSRIVGQDTLCWLLEVGYVMGSRDGGVLVSGERGTAKSTIVRSFSNMMMGKLPVTLPINATDDRVVGGWDINSLLKGEARQDTSLLEQADDAGMLYIDEVNLLDDHITNLILDVVSTNVLVLEREGIDNQDIHVEFMLVGTMNPDEGALRPQLLDRFGLFARVEAEADWKKRGDILRTVLTFDMEREKDGLQDGGSEWIAEGRRRDEVRRVKIEEARETFRAIDLTDLNETLNLCARVAARFKVVGHRAEIVMAKAACAAAALEGRDEPTVEDVARVARHAVMHRRRAGAYADGFTWSDDDETLLKQVISDVQDSQEA